jgi:transcription initiation factor IIE alpha subunit
MKEILEYLKKHGEKLDAEIAAATRIPLANVRRHLEELTAKQEIMSCHSIRYEKGKKIEGIRCRLTGFTPPSKPGAKPKVQLTLS